MRGFNLRRIGTLPLMTDLGFTRETRFLAGAIVAAGGLGPDFSAGVFNPALRLSSRFWVRRQAAAHSRLFMWVSRSQKPMQAAKLSPPPPGMLGADRLGLDVPEPPLPGKVETAPPVALGGVRGLPGGMVVVMPPGVVTVVPPPPLTKLDVGGGDMGAMAGTCGAGVPMAGGPSAPGVVGATPDGDRVSDCPSDGLLPIDGAAAAAPPDVEPPRPPTWAPESCGEAAMRRTAAVARHAARGLSMGHLRLRQRP
jgi:hypothetical protein